MNNRSLAYFTPKDHKLLTKYQRLRKQSELIGLSNKAKARLEWMIFYNTVANNNAFKTCKYFSISRSKFYYWLDRFNENNIQSLESKSTRPHNVRGWDTDPMKKLRMIKLRKEFNCKWGKRKLAKVYANRYKEHVSSWQFQKVIQSFNLYPVKRRRKCATNGVKKNRISKNIRQESNNLFSLDTIVLHLFGQKRYILSAIEHTTKRAYARVYTSHSSTKAVDFLKRLTFLVDNDIDIILTDNGSEFQKHFDKACKKQKLTRYYSRVATPTDNPEVERFNRTLKDNWLNEGGWHNKLHNMNKSLTNWLITYNNVRPHESLDDKTPLEYTAQTQNLSKMYSSCTTY